MKMLLAVLTSLLLAVGVNSLWAAPRTQTYTPPEFNFNGQTYLWDKLGFGGYDIMSRFMWEQVQYLTVEVIYGTNDDFNSSPASYKWAKDSETYENFVLRAANTQLQHAINVNHFPVNQQLTLKLHLNSGNTNGVNGQIAYTGQFNADNVYFTPQLSGSTYVVPPEIVGTLNYTMVSGVGETQQIPWTQIKRAQLVVFDTNGAVLYIGDSKNNSVNDTNLAVELNFTLAISRRFVTNSCNGILTVATGAGTSAMYLLKDGTLVLYPQTVSPLLTMGTAKGKFVINVKGGAPRQSISLLCYTNLSLPPQEVVLTLDEVGLGSWTNTLNSANGFFKARYPLH